jgi:hypothetical protein
MKLRFLLMGSIISFIGTAILARRRFAAEFVGGLAVGLV